MNWVHIVMAAMGLFIGLYFSKSLQFRRMKKENEAKIYHYQKKINYNERKNNQNGKVVNFPNKQQKAAR